MPIPMSVTAFNKRYFNHLTIRLAGRGSFADLEHIGRTSGRTFHTPLMAFRTGDAVTVALTYGPDVDWLKNVRAAGQCRMHLGGRPLDLGAPRTLDPEEGLRRMPQPQRTVLTWIIRCRDFVEFPVRTGGE
jgi:deazaflavin-dependent oxidoreductase (nitroreductase family)